MRKLNYLVQPNIACQRQSGLWIRDGHADAGNANIRVEGKNGAWPMAIPTQDVACSANLTKLTWFTKVDNTIPKLDFVKF